MIVKYRGATPDGSFIGGTIDVDTDGGIRDFEHVRELAAAIAERTNLTAVTLLHFESDYERA
jgi:phosphoribosylformimino-5-aminoimidazole carboxamide ribonucleotide (ProFAR) isomerase